MESQTYRHKAEIFTILIPDEESSERLCGFARAELGYQMAYPHLTLAHFIDVDAAALASWTEQFFSQQRSLSIELNELGILGPCLVFKPAPNAALERWHSAYNQPFDSYSDPLTSIKDGQWTPHCSLECSLDASEETLRAFCSQFTQLELNLAAVELSQLEEDGTFTIIQHIDLEK